MNLGTWDKTKWAGLKGKSGPPGNMNAFKRGLAAIQKRREEGVSTQHDENVRTSSSKFIAETGAFSIRCPLALCEPASASCALNLNRCLVQCLVRRPPSLPI